MSSSSIRTSDANPAPENLFELAASIPDPRAQRGVRYPASAIIAASIAAVLAGARSFVAIAEWLDDLSGPAATRIGFTGRSRPWESTIRRLFDSLNGDVIDTAIGTYLAARTKGAAGRQVIALDGKTVRGARTDNQVAPHLVSVFDHATGTVLGQAKVADKTNEIPCVRALLEVLDLAGTVVTLDALHTQRNTARQIVAAGGHYVLTVKNNTPTLRTAIEELPWKGMPTTRATTWGHGRKTTRSIRVLQAPRWIDFPGVTQVAQLRRTVTRKGKTSWEIVYLITSANAREAQPAALAEWILGHWGIENRLHWVRDVTFDEDRSQIRTGSSPRVMASMRNLAISIHRLTGATNIAKATRHHARNPERPLAALLTS